MMEEQFLHDSQLHMEKSLEVLRRELSTIRTGRANPAIIEHVQVEYYGAPTPLQQLATITSPDPRQLLVQPYDPTSAGAIEKAIRQSDLGFNPVNDGNLVRINIPTLTEERRRDMVKMVHKRVEEAKVAVRNVRRDGIDHLRRLQKDKEIREDEASRAQEQLQKVTDRFIGEAEAVGRGKEAEILEV
jgi:ribosome recycling factor